MVNLIDLVRGRLVPPELYQLPGNQITLDEDDGFNFVFSDFFGICVSLEIENRNQTTPLTYTINSLDTRPITLGGGVTKVNDRSITRSIHVKTAGATFTIRATLVPIELAKGIKGIEVPI